MLIGIVQLQTGWVFKESKPDSSYGKTWVSVEDDWENCHRKKWITQKTSENSGRFTYDILGIALNW